MRLPGKKVVDFSTLEEKYNVFELLQLKGLTQYVSADEQWINSKDSFYIRKKSIDFWCSTRKEGTRFLTKCPNIYNFGGNTSRYFFRVGDINIII